MQQAVATNLKNSLFQNTELQEANHFDDALCVLKLCKQRADKHGNYSR